MAGSREIYAEQGSSHYSDKRDNLPQGLTKLSEGTRREIIELPIFQERWKTNIPVITISGPSGTGKTVFGEIMAGILDMDFFKGGSQVRERYKQRHGKEIVGWDEKSRKDDEDTDARVRGSITAALNGRPTIVEARLAGVIATEILRDKDQKAIPQILRGLWIADSAVTAARVAERQGGLSVDEVRILSEERERKNLETWSTLHPILLGELGPNGESALRDFNDPFCIDENGRPMFYDFLVDTTQRSVAQTISFVHGYLLENDHIEKVSNQIHSQDKEIFPHI